MQRTFQETGHCRTSNCGYAQAMRERRALTADTVASLPAVEISIRYTAAPLYYGKGKVLGTL
ncbi:hypothetical protein LLH00_08135 [bacterium]|nr:hypothetical protein [bacterium]